MKRLLIVTLVIMLLAVTLLPAAAAPAQATAIGYNPDVLSYGMYWFGLNDAAQKFVPGEANPYFDPNKPTMIFVHGWQPGISASNPPNFTYHYMNGYWPQSVNVANAWINDGWNVGIFFWNQFSDEAQVTDAEAKIWVNNGPKGMRWRKGGNSYEDAPAGTPSAGELFYQAYVAALTDRPYHGGEIRIAGHSLGNQMAVRLTKLVSDGIVQGKVPANLLPTRVTLLDPYWSIGGKSYLNGKSTAEMVRQYVQDLLPKGVLFEWYRSSPLTEEPAGDGNLAMRPMMLYARMHPNFVTDNMSKHVAAFDLYFWSYAWPQQPDCSGDDCLGNGPMLARVSNTRLAALMRADYTWEQISGLNTATPADDVYHATAVPNAPYSIAGLTASTESATVGDGVTILAQVVDKNGDPAPDGVVVDWQTDFGRIVPSSTAQNGVAGTILTASTAGTAHVVAKVKGESGSTDKRITVTFTEPLPAKRYLYLPLMLNAQ